MGEKKKRRAAVRGRKKPAMIAFKYFRGALVTWQRLFEKAAAFATRLGPDEVVSISHSQQPHEAVVTVWYWTGARRS